MFWAVATGLGLLALAAGQQQCAQAGGNTRSAKRQRALRRMSPQARARALRKTTAAAGQQPRRVVRRPRRAPVRCQKLPWLSKDVERVALDVIDDGELRPEAITQIVLSEVYPVTPEGEPIDWPAIPEDCAALRLLEARTETRVRRYLATQADLLADQHYQT